MREPNEATPEMLVEALAKCGAKEKALRDRVDKLETALAGVIAHWREFGAMIVYNNATNRDDYGLDERIEFAAKLIPDRVAV